MRLMDRWVDGFLQAVSCVALHAVAVGCEPVSSELLIILRTCPIARMSSSLGINIYSQYTTSNMVEFVIELTEPIANVLQ